MRSRRQIWVDPKVQGALILRVVLYWIHCLITIAFMMTCWVAWSQSPRGSADLFQRVFHQYGPALGASLLLLPLVLVDCLRLSNRFVGPLYRLRRAMRALADGQDVPPQTFRQDDFWQDLADDFNRLAARVQQQDRRAEQQEEAGVV